LDEAGWDEEEEVVVPIGARACCGDGTDAATVECDCDCPE